MKGGRKLVGLIAILAVTVVVVFWCWLWLSDLFPLTPSRKLNGLLFTAAVTTLVLLIPGTLILVLKKKLKEREGITSDKVRWGLGEIIRTSGEFWGKTLFIGLVVLMTLISLAGIVADSITDWSSVVEAITSLLQPGK